MSTITLGGVETKDLKIEDIAELPDVRNYAEEQTIVEDVSSIVHEYIEKQEGLLETFYDELEYYDYMFRCGRNAEKKEANKPMASPEEARSNVGATMFFRQVMQSAGKLYSLQNARDRYFNYTPVQTKGVPYSAEDGRMQAAQMDTLAMWNLNLIGFDEKVLMPLDMAVPKNGLGFLMITWERKTETRSFTLPPEINPETGEVGETTSEEVELLTKNHANFKNLAVRSTRFDPNIEGIQPQECFSVCELKSLGDVVQMVKQGYWSAEQFKKLTSTHRWDGTSGNTARDSEAENADLSSTTNDTTGKFLLWRVWVNLPLSEEGVLDEKTIVPQRYICDFLGNSIDEAVCMRIQRNDDPDDEIPVEVICDYPDEEGRFFHISKGHVLKNNYAVETTAVNQMVDNVSLAQNPSTIERKGAVVKRPRRLGRGSRFIVKNSVTEDIREFQTADRTQTSLGLLQYTKEDSKMAIHTDPSQMGEGLGARATATEASGVMRLSAAPSVMNAKYVTKQAFSWAGRKLASYWKAFSLPEQVIQITDTTAPIQSLAPSEIYADFDVVVDIVDKVVDDIIEENKLSQDLKMISESPTFAQLTDVKALLDEYFIRRYKKSFVTQEVDYDAREAAMREVQTMLGGTAVTARQEQNHRIHLDVKRAERIRYRGLEAKYPQLQLLDNNIEQHAQMMQGQNQGQAAPQQAAQQPVEPQGGAGLIPADMGSAAQEATV
jgi:hypothetical protein